jgi:tRNA-specific 2-thiouridylase
VTSDGRVVGEHDGHARFTVGQRRGLPGGFAEPMFVVDIRPAERAVVIGPREQLLGRGVVARGVNWLTAEAPRPGARLEAQVRHRARAVPATLLRVDGDEIELALEEPVAAITPGQSLVLFDGDRVLGGGFIERATGRRDALPVLAA